MSVFAFVFARGGSKGLPGKNTMHLGGIPLIGHSILLAKQIESIDKIFISTDSYDIANVAKEFCVEVIMRPPELASDTASEWLAWQHAVCFLQEKGEEFDIFLSLPATSPLRGRQDVEQCLAIFDINTDMVVTVTPASRNPYFNMLSRDKDGYSEVLIQTNAASRRQDSPTVYDMTTVAYVTRPSFILNSTGVFSGRTKSIVVPKERSVDIDDEFDFTIAEAIYKNGNT